MREEDDHISSRLLEACKQHKDRDLRTDLCRRSSESEPLQELRTSLRLNVQEVVGDARVGGLPDPGQPQVPQASFQAALPCAEGDSRSLNCKEKKKNNPNTPPLPNSAPAAQAPIKDSNTSSTCKVHAHLAAA